ncbi:hypothetical protein [Enterococcus mundtii]|uniref:hypothetical protein n=1 Tax=Enterococcus mundtii TaxID=53346 RepID=UPI00115C2E56|nr:hypothetical protein [Enterococcus mundtii]
MGAFSSKDLKEWTEQNLEAFMNFEDMTELMTVLIPKLVSLSKNKTMKKIINQNEVVTLAIMWINGKTYSEILNYCEQFEVKITRRGRERTMNLSEIIDFCDNGLGYSTILTVNAIETFIKSLDEEQNEIIQRLSFLLKQLRYGLPNIQSINIYELGFSDRVICQEINNVLSGLNLTTKSKCKRVIKRNKDLLREAISRYPSYFSELLNRF